MKKYICVHGHFYQPPREDAWTGKIEEQPSAAPFHNWNERITAECYRPNTESPVNEKDGVPSKLLNNFAWISFNVGPTLMSWLAEHSPETYEGIIDGDRRSCTNFGGFGSAMAQAYNHIIMPLANERDKRTQVIWGIEDFQFRFGRRPLGMWLPETAVDTATLEVLAEHGILFTILAPKQARRVKPAGSKRWKAVTEDSLDVRRPYACQLPSGNSIVLFFYDGYLSNQLAFGDLIKNGQVIAEAMAATLDTGSEGPQIAHIATDGETYGHHRQFGNMALSYLIETVNSSREVMLTNYAEYLHRYPPTDQVEIQENTAWSSAVGVERWRSGGGGCIYPRKHWNQNWRGPLREAMDWLRDALIPVYEQGMAREGRDPWQARDEYIYAILQGENDHPLLEMQHMAMLMYTSCGWFFDDISGIETVQILQYAARAMELAHEHGGVDLEPEFLRILSWARSNDIRQGTGRDIYQTHIKNRVHHG
ncbi:MAG: DUF3536 domain-containing protein [Candidatus Omnitrophica bacterium]|nr:DUF3536 domain-containing protein [Candidatus Omnitrophota bacterium]